MSKTTTSPQPTRVSQPTRTAPISSRSIAVEGSAADGNFPAVKLGTPAMPRHRLREISFAPIQRCGCTKHYEKPLRTGED